MSISERDMLSSHHEGEGTRAAFTKYDKDFPHSELVSLDSMRPIVHKIDSHIEADGMLASSKVDVFGRRFGRDASITADFEVKRHTIKANPRLGRVINAIKGMCQYIATEDVLSAGIRKGQMMHEGGTLAEGYPPNWYIDKNGFGKNHDTLDGNGRYLNLIAGILAVDPSHTADFLPSVELLTGWSVDMIARFGGAAYVGAEFETKDGRTFPGLTNKRWRDCGLSTIGTHPIYPVEEQALYAIGLQNAADILQKSNPKLSDKARDTAHNLIDWFHKKFLFEDENGLALADALDGDQRAIKVISIDQMLALAPAYKGEPIIKDATIREALYDRSFRELFTRGGLRTISPNTPVPSIYQGPNSIWPHAQGLAVMALHQELESNSKNREQERYERNKERVIRLGSAMLDPIYRYQSPIETVQLQPDNQFDLYRTKDEWGKEQTSALIQTWTGAAGEYVITLLQEKYNMESISLPAMEHSLQSNEVAVVHPIFPATL